MLLAISKIEKSSDRDYLDILYRNNYSSLHKLAITILHDEHQAEDTVTTAMLASRRLFACLTHTRNDVGRTMPGAAYI